MKERFPNQSRGIRLLGEEGRFLLGGVGMTENTDWEMHPDGDETLTLLSGRIDIVLQRTEGEPPSSGDPADTGGEVLALEPNKGVCVVPAGVWHRQIVREPSELVFATPVAPRPTEHRTFSEEEKARVRQ